MKWSPNPGRKPRTGEALLQVEWENGQLAKHLYRADQLRWTKTGHDYDVAKVARA